MAYYLQYGTAKENTKKGRYKLKGYICAAIISLLLGLSLLFPQWMAAARVRLLPFLEPDVKSAFGVMIREIDNGESFTEAAAQFCKTVMDDAY